jgi:hypothetical protein
MPALGELRQTVSVRLGDPGDIFTELQQNIQSTQPGFWGYFHTADGLAER